MNVVCLLGRMTDEPELRHTQSDVAVTSFCVAVDRAYTPKGADKQTDFIHCVAWRQTAEFICRYFHKGQRMALQGSLQSRSYTDKDGNKRTVYEVIAEQVYFAENKAAGGTANQTGESRAQNRTSGGMDFEEIEDSDLWPF